MYLFLVYCLEGLFFFFHGFNCLMCTGVFLINALKKVERTIVLFVYIFLVVRICTDFEPGLGYLPLTLVQQVS